MHDADDQRRQASDTDKRAVLEAGLMAGDDGLRLPESIMIHFLRDNVRRRPVCDAACAAQTARR